jgi:hypothetical protein
MLRPDPFGKTPAPGWLASKRLAAPRHAAGRA